MLKDKMKIVLPFVDELETLLCKYAALCEEQDMPVRVCVRILITGLCTKLYNLILFAKKHGDGDETIAFVKEYLFEKPIIKEGDSDVTTEETILK